MIRLRFWLADRCLKLFLWLTPTPESLPQPVIMATRSPRTVIPYQPTPFELEAAKIVEHYDIPLVLTQDQHAFAVYGQKAGPC
jgi:hypothetical protein